MRRGSQSQSQSQSQSSGVEWRTGGCFAVFEVCVMCNRLSKCLWLRLEKPRPGLLAKTETKTSRRSIASDNGLCHMKVMKLNFSLAPARHTHAPCSFDMCDNFKSQLGQLRPGQVSDFGQRQKSLSQSPGWNQSHP